MFRKIFSRVRRFIRHLRVEDLFLLFATAAVTLVIYAIFDAKHFITVVNPRYRFYSLVNILTMFIRQGRIFKYLFFPLLVSGLLMLSKRFLKKKWNFITKVASLVLAILIVVGLFYAIPEETDLLRGYKTVEMFTGNEELPVWLVQTKAKECIGLDFFFATKNDQYTNTAELYINELEEEHNLTIQKHCLDFDNPQGCEEAFNLNTNEGNKIAGSMYTTFSPTLVINCNTMLKGVFSKADYEKYICELTEYC